MSPTGPGHGAWSDAVGAYVLGALPPEECVGFEAHMADCPACRHDVADLQVAADALPVSVPPVAPPPALRTGSWPWWSPRRRCSPPPGSGPTGPRRSPRARERRAVPRLRGWTLRPGWWPPARRCSWSPAGSPARWLARRGAAR